MLGLQPQMVYGIGVLRAHIAPRRYALLEVVETSFARHASRTRAAAPARTCECWPFNDDMYISILKQTRINNYIDEYMDKYVNKHMHVYKKYIDIYLYIACGNKKRVETDEYTNV